MRTTIGLVVVTAGAILTFAVSAQVPGINLRIAGVIVMAAGIAGLLPGSRAGAWLRRHSRLPDAGPVQAAPADEPEDAGYPAYLLQDPAVLAAEVLSSARANRSTRLRAAPTQLRPQRADHVGDEEESEEA
jgi:hypothetical protein